MNAKTKFHPVQSNSDGLFNARSGRIIDLVNPSAEMLDIEDIAGALANICRFGGQIKEFYSVAQHSVIVCCMALADGAGLEGLMHDAPEAYLGDVISPLKYILGSAYKGIESQFMACVVWAFDLNNSAMPLIKKYDQELLTIEHQRFQRGNEGPWYNLMERLGIPQYNPWTPAQAEHMFLEYYKRLKRN